MATNLQNLMTLTLQRSNQENSGTIGQQELINYLNNSLAEMYDILTTEYEDYDSHTYLATLTGSENNIPILSDVNKVRLVEYQYFGGTGGVDQYYPIQQYQLPQRNIYGNTPLNVFLPYNLAKMRYRVMGDNIIIEPVASCNGTYRIWYCQKYQNLVNPTDFLPNIMDNQAWSEYAVVDACIKIFQKQNYDASSFQASKAELKDRIVSAAANRTLGQPQAMYNVRRRGRTGGGFGNGGLGGLF